MRKITYLFILLTIGFSMGFYLTSHGQLLLEENFSYPVGDLLTAHGWAAHSGAGTNAITTTAPSITFPGYLSSGIGNEISMVATGEDDNEQFTSQTTGSVYTSFLVNITTATTTGDYFFHLAPYAIGTTFRGRVFVKKDASNNLAFGIAHTSTAVYTPFTYSLGTTYLIILKYTFVSGTANDLVSLFINPVIGTPEPLPTITNTDTPNDPADIGTVALRQGGSTSGPTLKLDGIRVGLAWTDVTGGGIAPPTVQASNITFSSVSSTAMTASWVNGDGSKRIVIMNTANSFTNPVDGTDPIANSSYSGSGEQVMFNNNGNSVTVTGLTGSTTYWFRVYEYNGTGATTKYLTTTATLNPNSQATAAAISPPTITSPTFAGITNYSAMLGGNITSDGGSAITERGTVWLLVPGVTIADNKVAEGGTAIGVFSQLRGSLPAKSKIYFKAYASNIAGSSLTSESSFFTFADEPTSHVTGFTATPGGITSINLAWTTTSSGADGYIILQKTGAVPPTGLPDDGTGYPVGTTIGDGTVAAIVEPASTLSKSITGLSPATQYSFLIIPFAWDGSNNETYNYFTYPVIPGASATTNGTGPATYTWQGADGGAWTTAANWNPARTTPAITDILQFNDGTSKNITALPTQTIGKFIMDNNTTINLQSSAAVTLTLSGVAGADLDIPVGCALNLNAINAISLVIGTTATANISGSMTFSSTASTAHRLIAVDAGAITFNSGAVFTAGLFFSGNAFGSASSVPVAGANSVIFASGSTYIHQAGSNPFALTAPGSVVVFQAGSLFKVISNSTPAFSGRTYANFEMNAPGVTLTTTGGNPVSIDDITITGGTFNFNMTGPTNGLHQIHGNIVVPAGSVLNFNPASAGTVVLNGTGAQAISGTGTITTGANSTIEISNSSGITLNNAVTMNGNLKLTNGLLTLGSNHLTLGTGSAITGTPSAAAMIVATGSGQLRKGFATGFTGSFVFPVGDNTATSEYSPVSLNFTSGTFTAGNYTGVNLVNAKYPLDPNTTSYLNRYWNITQNGITGFTCDAIFQYLPADVNGTENQIFCVEVDPLPFLGFDPANATLHQLTAYGLSGFGSYTGTLPPPSVITTPATGLGGTTATLNGTVNANFQTTSVSFEYGLTTSYGTVVAGVPAAVTGSSITSISAPISGLMMNTTYHFRINGTNAAGISNGNDLTFQTGCPIPSAATTITGPANVCQSGTDYVYSVPVIPNAVTYNWTLPAGASISAGANTNSITVSYSSIAVSGIISVYGSSICGNGTVSPNFAVTVNLLPVPTISGPASVCVNSANNVYSTQAGMTGYTWTISTGGIITSGATTNSITVTWTTTGSKTVTVNYTNANGCAGATPASFPVSVVPPPVPTITGPNIVCASSSGVVYTTQAGMSNYTWSVSLGGTIISGAGTNAITVSWPYAGNRFVSVNYTNTSGCSALTPSVCSVTVNPAAIPTIGSSNNPCINSTNNQYITNGGMSNYVWAISSGGTIVSGQGTSIINVTWTSIGAQWVSVSYTNSSGCTAVTPTVYNLFVNPYPNAAGTITGTPAVCGGATGISYSCSEILNATTYLWTLPTGASIISGAGTNHITVNFASNATSGNITVAGNNSCGNGTVSPAFAVTVTPLPAAAGTITGPSAVCAGASGVSYQVPVIPNATSYLWTVPAGATITSGAATNHIVLTFGTSPATGIINVKGTNTCGNGVASPNFNVTVNAIPPAPVVSVSGAVLTSSMSTGNQWYYEGTGAITGATGQSYTANKTGWYWVKVTVNGCTSPESNHVYIVFTGQPELGSNNFSVYPVPNNGQFTISLTSQVQDVVTIQVFNQIGVKIYELSDVMINGTIEKQVDIRPVPNGVYSVIFVTKDHKVVKKVMINK